jgi:hypothetical protein
MLFRHKKELQDKYHFCFGEKIVTTRFLWYPLRLKNETRWLEKIGIIQIFYNYAWRDIEFIDENFIVEYANKLLINQKWMGTNGN